MGDIYIEIINEDPLEVVEMVEKGDDGKSAYQSYLDTTEDDPPLSEEEWAAAGNGGGTVDDAAIAAIIHAATSKTIPADADEIGATDSAALFGLKKLTWATIKATLKSYFDTLYQAAGITWATLSGKPETFPPSAHNQTWGTITDRPLSFTPDLTGVTPNDIGAATAAQGTKADTAVQPEALLSANVNYANTAGSSAGLINGTISGTTSFSGGAAAQFRTALGLGAFATYSPIGFAIRNNGAGGTPGLAGTTWTKLPMTDQATLWNQGNGWNLSTGTFTAPVAGVYHVYGLITANLKDQVRLIVGVYKNGSLYSLLGRGANSTNDPAGNACGFSGATDILLSVGDTIELWYYVADLTSTLVLSPAGYVTFGAHLVYKT